MQAARKSDKEFLKFEGRSSPVNMKRRYAFLALATGLCVCATCGAATEGEQTRIKQAKKLIDNRAPAAALAVLEPLLAANPELPGVRYQAALAAQMTGDSSKAASLAAEALERKEETSELQVLIGVIAMEDKKYAEAARAFERASELDPSNSIALYNLSEALREEGRPQEAMGKLEEAIKLEPKRKLLPLKMRLAQIETGQKGFEEIESEVIRRQNDEKQPWDWLMTAAAVHLSQGSYRQATDALRAAKAAAGLQTVKKVFSEDHFFREFADDKEIKDIRGELELE